MSSGETEKAPPTDVRSDKGVIVGAHVLENITKTSLCLCLPLSLCLSLSLSVCLSLVYYQPGPMVCDSSPKGNDCELSDGHGGRGVSHFRVLIG